MKEIYNTDNVYCIIMAGGVGSRFWPLSRKEKPKQFIDILGTGHSLLYDTIARFEPFVTGDHIYVMTGKDYSDDVMKAVPGIKPSQILTEPARRNTAPCIAYAAYKIYAENPNATMIVTPSDHFIGNPSAFRKVVQQGINYVQDKNVLLTVGIPPTFPATGYGYIEQSAEAITEMGGPIIAFKEKPSEDLAQTFLDAGTYLWNSGMFIWKVKDIIDALEEHLPSVAVLFAEIDDYGKPNERERVEAAFLDSPAISIDYGVMEKAKNVHVLPGNFDWDDLGTWEALRRHRDRQLQNVPDVGDEPRQIELLDSPKTLVHLQDPKKRAIVRGLEDYLVVDMEDVLVIVPKSDEDKLHEWIKNYSERY